MITFFSVCMNEVYWSQHKYFHIYGTKVSLNGRDLIYIYTIKVFITEKRMCIVVSWGFYIAYMV